MDCNQKISVITICFNNENDIKETLESVINQTYDNIEYIVVDGGSTDKTLSIIDQYKDNIHIIISEPDKGLYDAINKGIRISNGDIFGLIHAGDRLYDSFVIREIAHHFEKSDIDASYGHSLLVNSKDIPVRVNKSPEFKKKLFERGWMPSHQSVYIRKELINKFGYYRLDLGGSADYEFILRYFYFNDIRVRRLDKFILRFSIGGISTSNYRYNLIKSQKKQLNAWVINGVSPPRFLVFLKLARKIQQFYLAIWYRINKRGINKFTNILSP